MTDPAGTSPMTGHGAGHGGWDEDAGVDVRSWSVAIRRQWRLLVVGVVAGALVGVAVAAVQGPRHVATETVRVTARPAPGEAPRQDPEVLADELDQLVHELRSPALEQAVSQRLDGVAVTLTSGTAEESRLVTVEAVADTPEAAATAVGEAVDLVVQRRRATAVAEAEATATRLRERADELGTMAGDVADQVPATDVAAESGDAARLRRRVEILLDQQADFERRATDIEITGQTTPIGLERVDIGQVPTEPAAPTRGDLVLLLAAVGAILALAWTWLRELRHGPRVTRQWLAERVRAEVADVDSPTGLEALAMGLVDRSGGLVPALGYLQVGAGQVDLEPGPLTLALTMGAFGRPVTVLDGDLRTAGPRRGRGLASHLAGVVDADDVAGALPAGKPTSPRVLDRDPAPPANPLRLARSTRLTPLFEALSTTSDVLVVVPDPVVRPEALLLLADVVGVVLEVEVGLLRRRRLADVVQRLDDAGLPVVAVVATDRRPGGDRPTSAGRRVRGVRDGRSSDASTRDPSTTVRRVESTNRRGSDAVPQRPGSTGGARSGTT